MNKHKPSILTFFLFVFLAADSTVHAANELAWSYIQQYPWRPTFAKAQQTSEQWRTMRAARIFVEEHPAEALATARAYLKDNPDDWENALGFLSLAPHRSFEPLYLEAITQGCFPKMTYWRYCREGDAFFVQCHPVAAIPLIVERAEDRKSTLAAVRILGWIGQPDGVAFLASSAHSDDPFIASLAVDFLSKIEGSEAANALFGIVDDAAQSNDLRFKAAKAMAAAGDRRAIPYLEQRLMACKESSLKENILKQLFRLAPERAPEFIREFGMTEMARFLDPSVGQDLLLDLLTNDRATPRQRYTAFHELISLGDRRVLPIVKEEVLFGSLDFGQSHVSLSDLFSVLSEAGDPEASDIREWLVTVNRIRPSDFDFPVEPLADNRTIWENSFGLRDSVWLQRSKRRWRKTLIEACKCPTAEKVPLVLDYLGKTKRWQEGILRKDDIALACEYLKRHPDAAIARLRTGHYDGRRDCSQAFLKVMHGFLEAVARFGDKEDRAWVLKEGPNYGFGLMEFIDALLSDMDPDALALVRELTDKGRNFEAVLKKNFPGASSGWLRSPDETELLYIRVRMGDVDAREPLLDIALLKSHTGGMGFTKSPFDDDRTLSQVFPFLDWRALGLIGKTKDPAFREPLRKALQLYREDEDPYFALTATLADLGDEESIERLVQWVESEGSESRLRIQALEKILQYPEVARNHIRGIEKAALSEDTYLSKAAIEALQEHGDRKTLEFLYRIPLWLRRPITEKTIFILEEKYPGSAREKPDKDAPPLKRVYFEGPLQPAKEFSDRLNELFHRLENELAEDKGPDSRHSVNVFRLALNMAYPANPETAEPLVKLFSLLPAPGGVIRTSSYETHDTVSNALSKIGPPAIDPLIRMYKNGNETQRLSAISVLGRIKVDDPRISEILTSALSDKDGNVRWEAVRQLGWNKDPVIIQRALELLRSDEINPLAKYDCIRALREIGSDAAVDQMTAALKAPEIDIHTKIRLVRALGTMEHEKALATVKELTESPDEELRKAATEALTKQTPKEEK